MQFKSPRDDDKYKWTNHVKQKMLYYGISESLVKRIVRVPKRIEYGVAPNTVAVMFPYGSSREAGQYTKELPYRGEIWVMYQEIGRSPISGDKQQATSNGKNQQNNLSLGRMSPVSSSKRIISAWRYPGISKPGTAIPIPDEILTELESVLE